jgi:hypothetical protein
VIPIFSRNIPNLGAAGKFLGLIHEPEPCLYVSIDDDIGYASNYVAQLHARIEAHGFRVVVGVHGTVLNRPFTSYRRDRKVFYFADALKCEQAVDLLGTGTMMFDTAVFRFDVRRWIQVNMVDLNVAVEAAKTGLPMICVAREENFLRTLQGPLSDSIFHALKKDDSRQTSRALELLAFRAPKTFHCVPKIEIFAMHGVADRLRSERFQYRNLLEAEQFCAFLRSAPKFVPLDDALQGRGRALTIDDATVASARAAKLARDFGHAVTLFINPWNIEAHKPYWFSRLNTLLDSVDAPKFLLDGRMFDLTTFAGKSEFRTHIKTLMRRHTNPEDNITLIDRIEEDLGVGRNEIPPHDRCLDTESVRELHGVGVDIQNHGWTHLDPLAGNLAQFTEQFHKARSWLKDRLAIETRFFASPFGEFLPHTDFLRRYELVCLLLHHDLPPGNVEDHVVNRITLRV